MLTAAPTILLTGCAAFTNPVANGIPVRLLPDELLAESREQSEPVDLTMLRQPPLETYTLDVGDTLGIYVEGIIGDAATPPPVNAPSTPEEPPAIGFPFPIRANGTISLPLIDPVDLVGKTIEEAEDLVKQAYRDKEIIRAEERNPRIIVTLLRPRTVRVLVVREDGSSPGLTVSNQSLRGFGTSTTSIGGDRGRTGDALELPVGQNDLLTALTSTGGLPGLGAKQEVLIYRGYVSGEAIANGCSCDPGALHATADAYNGERRVIRVPLQKRCGTRVVVPREDIVLQDGDILTINALRPEFFYTGGLLPAGEFALPADYDLRAVEAVLRSNGPLVSGGVNGNNLSGNIVGAGVGNPSPSLLTVLRRLPNGQQVNILVDLNEALRDPRQNLLIQADDVLVLQENRDEAFARYFNSSVFQTNLFVRWLNRGDAQGTATFLVP